MLRILTIALRSFLISVSLTSCLALSDVSGPLCLAAGEETSTKLFFQRDKQVRQEKRRDARKTAREMEEVRKERDSSRDNTRLDYKVRPNSVRVTDSRLNDRKSPAAEIRREREEAKLKPEAPVAGAKSIKARNGHQDLFMKEEDRDLFGLQ
jgi:hypothetical protein